MKNAKLTTLNVYARHLIFNTTINETQKQVFFRKNVDIFQCVSLKFIDYIQLYLNSYLVLQFWCV